MNALYDSLYNSSREQMFKINFYAQNRVWEDTQVIFSVVVNNHTFWLTDDTIHLFFYEWAKIQENKQGSHYTWTRIIHGYSDISSVA